MVSLRWLLGIGPWTRPLLSESLPSHLVIHSFTDTFILQSGIEPLTQRLGIEDQYERRSLSLSSHSS